MSITINSTNNMARRSFLTKLTKSAGATIAAPYFITSGCKKTLTKKRPNILLIMADDMGFSDLGCYGSEINTPNLDALAKAGIRFTHFYNAARCCPTRASLLTGLYPHQAGMGAMVKTNNTTPGPYQGYINDQCVTIAELLKQADYKTLMAGKWHVGENRPNWPVDRGFDHYFGLISGAANYFDYTKTKAEGVTRTMALDDQPFIPPKDNFYMTDAITDHAVKMLSDHEKNDKPFFMYVAYTAPHWPLHALPQDIKKYKNKYLDGWEKLQQKRFDKQKAMGLFDETWPLPPLDKEITPWDNVPNKEEMDLKMAIYAAQIDRMDQGIGKIFELLKQQNKYNDTIIMFLSDNGGCAEGGPWGFDRRQNGLAPGGVDSYMSYGQSWAHLSNTPFTYYKKWVHEGGIATPFIVSWPNGIKYKNEIFHQTGHIIDILPTCIDLAGAGYPDTFKGKKIVPVEGKSLLPVFNGDTRKRHDYLFWEHLGNKAVLHENWKLVKQKDHPWELYDQSTDRNELNNVIEKHPDIYKKLLNAYTDWELKCGVNNK